ncbi:hypothetical protein ES702_01795 [subsurface metagenome]
MKLNIPERLALLNVLPQQGGVVTLRIVRELQNQLSFTEEEMEEYKIKNTMLPNGGATVNWNPKLTAEKKDIKDIKIGKTAKSVIKQQLTRLDSQGQLHISMLPIYDRFIEGESKESA